MKIWIFNNYNMLPNQGGLNRHYYFGANLKKLGHEPIVFVGSHPHNTDLQLIEGKETFKIYQETPFPWVLVRTCKYANSKVKRVWSMVEFYLNGRKASKHFARPDAILGSSAHPLAAVLAIHLGKKFKCKSIVEVRDLWPESIVVCGIAGPKNPAVIALRWLEKWIYKKADAVVFTVEGAYDYIIEQGWEKEIPREKVHYINNGVDMELFNYNREHHQIKDEDLASPDIFKVVYAGSIRLANGLQELVDCAAQLKEHHNIRFLIYGSGEDLERLKDYCKSQAICNVIFKGRVEKKYIPYILSKSSLNMLNYDKRTAGVFKYGSSQNKLFEYLASGKPILSNVAISHSIIERYRCGESNNLTDAHMYAEAILKMAQLPDEKYQDMCENAKEAAKAFDFKNLTEKLISVIKEVS